MQNNHWTDLLRLIPEDQQNKLVVTTLTGVDLNIEIILRLDETFLVFRGRISGITDEGRVFFVPYRQIDYLQLNRHVKEEEIHAMFGDGPAADAGRPLSGTFESAPSGVFAAVKPTPGSRQGQSTSPASPSSPAPTRPSLPGIAAKLSNPAIASPVAEGPTPPRNSILERLRAQRNSVATTKPSSR